MPDFKLGSTTPSRMYLGSNPVQYVYLGSTLVWPVQVEPTIDEIRIEPTNYRIELTSSGSFLVNVSANGIWSASTNNDWITVTKTNIERATVAYTENNSVGWRQGTVTFTCGEASATLTIEQKGISGSITVEDTPTSNLSAGSGSFEVNVTCNTAWTASTNVDWIHLTTDSASGSGSYTVTINIDSNINSSSTTQERTGTVTFTPTNGNPVSFTVTQNGHVPVFDISMVAKNWYNDTTGQWPSGSPGVNGQQTWQVKITDNPNTTHVVKITVVDSNSSQPNEITTVFNSQQITVPSNGMWIEGSSKVNDHEEYNLSLDGATVENNSYRLCVTCDGQNYYQEFRKTNY